MEEKLKKLIIFDCDGVLVDSEIISNSIDAQMLSEYGYKATTEDCIRKFTGLNNKTVSEFIFRESGILLPENYVELSQKRIVGAFENELKSLIRPVLEYCLDKPRCVASSSPKARVWKSLELTRQDHYFLKETVFTSSEVERGKPFPDLFLYAAEKMGVRPESCLVIEDSIAGIKAAKSAGMSVVSFLGGDHTNFDWYKADIKALNVPVCFDAEDVIEQLQEFYW